MHKIALMGGDGTGPEVLTEGLKVINAASKKYGFKYETVSYDFGGERYKRTGETLPDSAIEEFKKADAIYLGAIGSIVAIMVNATYIDVFESSKVAYTLWIVAAFLVRTVELERKNVENNP